MDHARPVTKLNESQRLYLDLLKTVLTRTGFRESYRLIGAGTGWHRYVLPPVRWLVGHLGLELMLRPDSTQRSIGGDHPSDAETMVGMARLTNIEECLADVLVRDVPGDVIETGVWRGGSAIFMRAVLQCYGDTDRIVWVADSFRGLPKATLGDPDAGAQDFWKIDHLAVSEEDVRANFAKYGLLDNQVRFLPGWFCDTLPTAPIEKLSLLRLDGDLYESTMDALSALYPKLSPGGYVIIDDYAITGCRDAVEDYRREFAIGEPIERIDWTGVFWKKSG